MKRVDQYVYDEDNKLGGGAFGDVFLGHYFNQAKYDLGDNVSKAYSKLAIKKTKYQKQSDSIFNEQKINAATKEINILRPLDHPNIIKFIDAKLTGNNIYLIMEYCNGGDFKQLLQKLYEKQQVSLSQIFSYFREIIDVFRFLRERKLVHRDVKPANILIHDGILKLADFGLARVVLEESQRSVVGTPLFQDPNISEDRSEGYNTKSDIYSLGVLLWHMIYYDRTSLENSYPWYHKNSIDLEVMKRNTPLRFPDQRRKVSDQIKDLIIQMLDINMETRISWENLFKHELLMPCGKKEDDMYFQECRDRLQFEFQFASFMQLTANKLNKQIFPFLEEFDVYFSKEDQQQLLFALYKKSTTKLQNLVHCLENKQNNYNIQQQAWKNFIQVNQTDLKKFTDQCLKNLEIFNKSFKTFQEQNMKHVQFEAKDFGLVMRNSIKKFEQPFIFIHTSTQEQRSYSVLDPALINGIYNLFAIFASQSTVYSSFQYDPKNPIDFNQFYSQKQKISQEVLVNRISKAYVQLNKPF